MQSLEEFIRNHFFFAEVDPSHCEAIAKSAAILSFEPGQPIIQEGAPAVQFYLITHGKVSLDVHTPSRGDVSIQTLTAGEVVGWSWIIPPYQWLFDARAVEHSDLIVIDGKALRERCEQDHQLGYLLLKNVTAMVANRLHGTRIQLLDIYGVHS
ncbi:MAG: cyclic nucleotide-binding domain-containing protein [Planctomycetota bacterium]|nr:cyclic nucleotide-binding domain-containing protein [Planctomycetota bacterium]